MDGFFYYNDLTPSVPYDRARRMKTTAFETDHDDTPGTTTNYMAGRQYLTSGKGK